MITEADIYSDAGVVDLRFVTMNHGYKVGNYQATAPSDGPHEHTSVKYGAEQDATFFTGNKAAGESKDWRDADCGDCVDGDKTTFCSAGLNYDNKRGFCGTGASGWPAGTDPSKCRQLMHRCQRAYIYYWRIADSATGTWAGNAGATANRGGAMAPITKENVDIYEEAFKMGRRRAKKTGIASCVQKYTFALKKWTDCHATNVTNNAPLKRTCKEVKRCPCIKCELPTDAGCVTSGKEPCNCDDLPSSVMASIATRCGNF